MKKILFISLFILFLSACNNGNNNNTDREKNTEHEENGNAVTVTKEQFEAENMKLGSLSEQTFSEFVPSNGTIDVPPKNKYALSAYYGGYVKNIKPIVGDFVKRREVLITLENPEYLRLQRDYLELKEQLAYLKSEYERKKQLVKEQIVSPKSYLKAKSDYFSAKVKLESLKKELALLGINTETLRNENISSQIVLRSPVTGYVSFIQAEKGEFIPAQKTMIKIINPEHKHVELQVFEKDLSKIKKNADVFFHIENDSGKIFKAKIFRIGKSVDEKTRTVRVHAHPEENGDNDLLIPGMYVRADIVTKRYKSASLPVEAIVDDGDTKVIFVLKSQTGKAYVFEKLPVKTGRENDSGYIEILNAESIPANAEILVKGSYFLSGNEGED